MACDTSFVWSGRTLQSQCPTPITLLQKEALLITLGQDEAPNTANLKVWNLEGQAKSSTATPPLLKSLRLFTPKQPEAPVTAVAVQEENWPQMTLAIGLANGSIYVIRGDVGMPAIASKCL